MFQNYVNYSNSPVAYGTGHYLNGIKVNKIDNILGLMAFGGGDYYEVPTPIKQNLLIGTDKGFYFSSSIYTSAPNPLIKFSIFHDDELGNIVINDICVNAVSTDRPICEDGVWLGASDGLYLVKPDYAKYLNSQTLQAISFKNQPETFSQINICSGDSTSVAVNTSQYSGGTIQWYKDGHELPAQSKDTLGVKTAGNYYALLYDPCEDIHLESNHLTVNVVNSPVFTFNYPDKIQQCNNAPITLQTNNTVGYKYRWYTDDILNGDTTSSFVATQTGRYKVEVGACTNSWVPSKEVEVDLINLPVPVITTNKKAYCIGDNAILSINTPSDSAYTVNWYKDNVLLTADENLNSITTNVAGDYMVSVTNNTVNTDGTICSQASVVQPLLFNPLPLINIEKIASTTLCEGQTIYLAAHHSAGAVQWSTGENTDQIAITTAGEYKITVTSPAGCQADTSIDVTFFANPILNIKDTTICSYKNQSITLTAPGGFSQYEWNGIVGVQTYQVNSPQAVNLIVTDSNGCQATQTINVTEQCPDIWIPNTFTPNNDGINDTWTIQGLDNDQTVSVRVFNRYGTQIFESKRYPKPWNGEYNGKKLPAGVYYYIVTAKNDSQKFSGSLTIIY